MLSLNAQFNARGWWRSLLKEWAPIA